MTCPARAQIRSLPRHPIPKLRGRKERAAAERTDIGMTATERTSTERIGAKRSARAAGTKRNGAARAEHPHASSVVQARKKAGKFPTFSISSRRFLPVHPWSGAGNEIWQIRLRT